MPRSVVVATCLIGFGIGLTGGGVEPAPLVFLPVGVADSLRRLTNEELALFFAVRGELADPPPASFTDLATRASTPYSLQACLMQIDQGARQVVEALAFLGEPSSAADVAALAAEVADLARITAILDHLRVLGLVLSHAIAPDAPRSWTLPPAMRRLVVAPFQLRPGLASVLDRFSVGDLRTISHNLGLAERPVAKVGLIADVANFLSVTANVDRLLEDAPTEAVAALEGIHEVGGVVAMDTRPWARTELPTSVGWLLSHALLVPANGEAVVVPREIAIALRGGASLRRFVTEAPEVVAQRGPRPPWAMPVVDLTPLAVIDAIAQIGTIWQRANPVALRSGGVAVKDVRAMAKAIGMDDRSAGRLIELAGVAGLVIADEYNGVVTTPAFDEWLRQSSLDRWRALVQAWANAGSSLSRVVPSRPGDKGESPLSPMWFVDNDEIWRRVRVIDALAQLPEGTTPTIDSLARRATWHEPGRWATGAEGRDAVNITEHLIAEASLLGVVHGGALTALGRAELLGTEAEVESAAAAVFPVPVTTFTAQADLTALAPGELDAVVASELGLLATVESKRAATVYRFSEGSLRRAFDHGRTADELLAFLDAHARPSVPQPLRYLVEDVARRYGSLRLGPAVAYVRSDDPALIAGLLRAKKVAKLKLRQIAPTVVVSSVALPKLIVGLREAGFLPVEEDEAGLSIAAPAGPREPRFVRTHAGGFGRPRTSSVWNVVRGVGTSSVLAPGGVVERLRAADGPTLL